MSSAASLWEKYPGLVWSNRQASDDVRIRAALLKPWFHTLLDIAVFFGLERVEHEWQVLLDDPEVDTSFVQPEVTRILKNIRRGFEQSRS